MYRMQIHSPHQKKKNIQENMTDPHPSKQIDEESNYIQIQPDDIPGSVRRIVEQCLWNGMAHCEKKLDALSIEAQNMVSDSVNHYRKQMIDALIQLFETKNVITADDIRKIHEVLKSHLF